MEPFIQITRYPYEEPDFLNLVVTATNGRFRGELEIYSSADDLAKLAQELRGFPNGRDDEAVWELGPEDPEIRWAFYFCLRVKRVDPSGQCSVEVRFDNNRDSHHREIAAFSIRALPADLDRLAQLLDEFGKLEHRTLVWNVTDGELRR